MESPEQTASFLKKARAEVVPLASERRAKQSRYEEFFKLAEDGIVFLEIEHPSTGHRFLDVNPAFCRLLGYSRAEMLRMGPLEVISPEERSGIPEEFEIARQKGMLHHEKTLLAKDGGRIPVEITSRLFQQNGKFMVVSIVRNVADRKRMEEALRASEQRFETMARSSFEGICFCREGTVVDCNEQLAEMYGYRREELIGQRVADLIAPEWRKTVLEKIHAGQVGAIEHEVIRKDGMRLTVEARCRHLPSEDCPIRVASIRDVTERKRIEEAIRESEERLRWALEGGGGGAWDWDIVDGEGWLSEEMCKLLGVPAGYRLDAAAAMAVIVCQEDRDRLMQTAVEAILQRRDFQTEFRIRQGDRETRWVAVYGRPVFDASGQAVRLLGLAMDITERKRAEERTLRKTRVLDGINRIFREALSTETEEQLGEVCLAVALEVTGSEIGFIGETNERGRMKFIVSNPPWEACEAFLPEEHRRKPADFGVNGLFGRVLRGGQRLLINDAATQVQLPPGHPPVRSLLAVPLVSEGKTVGVAAVGNREGGYSDEQREDLEALAPAIVHALYHKRVEEALQELNETLEQRVAERTAEVEEKAQQLRSLAMQLGQAEQRERKRLAKILHDHIQQLIVAARMQLGWMENEGDLASVHAVVRDVKAILQEALEASRSLTIDLSPPVLHDAGLIGGLNWLATNLRKKNQFCVRLLADSKAEPGDEETRVLLFECVRELLFNAVKHAGVSEAQVTLARMREGHLKLIVSDKGRGFDPDLLRKRRSDEATFGLFSCQERLMHIGGRMEIETSPGQGARIMLTVPECEVPAAEDGEAGALEGYDEPVAVERRADVSGVLIVDDHKIVRDGLVKLLQCERDIEVVGEAADGPTAIRLAGQLRPDVIIMDINLGEMSGVEATRRILERYPGIRVIGLSVHTDPSVAETLLAAGASAYLTKCGPAEELIRAVRSCAGKGRT